jgi:hypothetical protein
VLILLGTRGVVRETPAKLQAERAIGQCNRSKEGKKRAGISSDQINIHEAFSYMRDSK